MNRFVESGQGDRILVGPDCGRPACGTPHLEVRGRAALGHLLGGRDVQLAQLRLQVRVHLQVQQRLRRVEGIYVLGFPILT